MLQMKVDSFDKYLESTDIIDFHSQPVRVLVEDFKNLDLNDADLVKRVFEFVRDEFPHSFDINGSGVSIKASDVLKNGHGICYAKSHLLAAILRGLGIPAGFCYQKLVFSDDSPKVILHAVNAVFIKSLDLWIRLDARGNKPGVNAKFSLYEEMLAFPVRPHLGEADGKIIYPGPLPVVISALTRSKTIDELKNNLPE